MSEPKASEVERGKSRPRRLLHPLPPKRPMARARRVSFFEREIRIKLASSAIEILFDRSSLLSEGQLEEGGRYYGSTMITVDCRRAAALISDPCDAATVKRVGDLCACDERVRERARRVGIEEAERLAGVALEGSQVDIRVRTSGAHLHIDVDVEARSPRRARNA